MTVSLEHLPRIAAEAGWGAASVLAAAKFGGPVVAWAALTEKDRALKIEVAKSVLGVPNTLTAEDEVWVGDIAAFIAVVRQACVTLGFTIIVPLPQSPAAPVDEPSFDDYPDPSGLTKPEETYDDGRPN